MSVEKLSVSLPGSLANRIDELAQAEGISRSALIQEAAAQYVASRDAVAREASRRKAVDASLEGFDQIAAVWGADERAGVQYLADVRGESLGSAPVDGTAETHG